MTKHVIAIDLGAGSGRVVLGKFHNNKIDTQVIHRFHTHTIRIKDSLHWNLTSIIDEIFIGLKKVGNITKEPISSIGIDAWGVDYVLLDESEEIIQMPYHYRDNRTEGSIEVIDHAIGNRKIFDKTGIQVMTINTINQLYVHDTKEIKQASTILFIANYIVFYLTGHQSIDYSIMSTTSLLNMHTMKVDEALLDEIHVDKKLFHHFGQVDEIGIIKKEHIEVLGNNYKQTKVLQVMSHDTACAVLGTPIKNIESAFISAGTWSLLGVVLDKPIINNDVYSYNFTNELGYQNAVRFIKNINGLFVLQEFFRENNVVADAKLFQEFNAYPMDFETVRLIDIDADIFQKPGQMKMKIDAYLADTNQHEIEHLYEYYQTIIMSLSIIYKRSIKELESILGYKLKTIHLVGGGSQNELLCQLTADLTGLEVIAGPVEATVLGNILNQLLISKDISSKEEIDKLIQESEALKMYNRKRVLNQTYQRYLKIVGRE